MTMRLIQCVLLGGLLAGCATTTIVEPIGEIRHKGDGGTVMQLPMTTILVDVPITRTAKMAGKYWEWTPIVFGKMPKVHPKYEVDGKPVASTEGVEFEVDAPTMAPDGQPDPSKIYYAQIRGGPFSDSSMSQGFAPNGVTTSFVTESENKTVDFVVSTLEAVAAMAKNLNAQPPAIPADVQAAKERADAAIKLYQAFIMPSTGGSADLPTYEARLKEAKKVLAEALEPFFGTTQITDSILKYRVIPTSPTQCISLFSYDASGVVKSLTTLNKHDDGIFADTNSVESDDITVMLTLHVRPQISKAIADNIFKLSVRGVAYNLPAPGKVVASSSVKGGKATLLATTPMSFGQFGGVGFLPATIRSRKLHQEVILDPATGALVTVRNSSTAFDPQLINRTGDALSSLSKGT